MGSAVNLTTMTDSLRSHNSNPRKRPRKRLSPHAAVAVTRPKGISLKLNQGLGMSKSLQIFCAVNSMISRCRGMDEDFCARRLT